MESIQKLIINVVNIALFAIFILFVIALIKILVPELLCIALNICVGSASRNNLRGCDKFL